MVKKTALEKFEEMCYFLAEWIKKLQFLRTFLSVYTTRKKKKGGEQGERVCYR